MPHQVELQLEEVDMKEVVVDLLAKKRSYSLK